MSDDMAARIRRASVMDIGFSYMSSVGLSFLSWPLPMMPFDPAAWLGQVAAAVASAPVCGRTEGQVWAELGKIRNPTVERALAKRGKAQTA